MKNNAFVDAVRRIAESSPTYREGGTGKDGTCDCIGLVMGALGKDYPMHSTNYFARFQMRVLDCLLDESQLHEGAVVYKSRRSVEQLHERYQPGGRYYTGDLLDYYHVGVVTSIDPLEITHCTSTDSINGIAYDSSIRAWSHIGDLLDVEYAEAFEPEGVQPETTLFELAVVYSENGNPVKLRSTPSTKLPYIAEVPRGARVEVLESAGEWSTIRWNGQRGYMMSQYLRAIGNAETMPKAENRITITISADAAMELQKALSGVL